MWPGGPFPATYPFARRPKSLSSFPWSLLRKSEREVVDVSRFRLVFHFRRLKWVFELWVLKSVSKIFWCFRKVNWNKDGIMIWKVVNIITKGFDIYNILEVKEFKIYCGYFILYTLTMQSKKLNLVEIKERNHDVKTTIYFRTNEPLAHQRDSLNSYNNEKNHKRICSVERKQNASSRILHTAHFQSSKRITSGQSPVVPRNPGIKMFVLSNSAKSHTDSVLSE